jgi:hypothetical protein
MNYPTRQATTDEMSAAHVHATQVSNAVFNEHNLTVDQAHELYREVTEAYFAQLRVHNTD